MLESLNCTTSDYVMIVFKAVISSWKRFLTDCIFSVLPQNRLIEASSAHPPVQRINRWTASRMMSVPDLSLRPPWPGGLKANSSGI